jgi:hypothetical protein
MIRMFSVTTSAVVKRTILTIDGQLSGDYIEVVEICCDQAESEGKPIDVFLHNVSTIDESSRALLTRLAAKGVRLLAALMWTPYVCDRPRSSRFRGVNLYAGAAGTGRERTKPGV